MNESKSITGQLDLIPHLESEAEELKVSERFLRLLQRSKEYAKKGLNENSRRSHEVNWRLFSEWCEELGHSALPTSPLTLITHVTDLADSGKKFSTIKRRLATISKAHELAHLPNPTLDASLKEHYKRIQNVVGVAKNKKRNF